MVELILPSHHDTVIFGERLGKLLPSGSFVALVGDLGAGKTSMSQGIANGLGICEQVNSPTFTLLHQYDGRLPLYHFDLYRLDNQLQVLGLGWDEFLMGDGVCLVEWADKFTELWPNEYLEIKLSYIPEHQGRLVTMNAIGEVYLQIIEEMKAQC